MDKLTAMLSAAREVREPCALLTPSWLWPARLTVRGSERKAGRDGHEQQASCRARRWEWSSSESAFFKARARADDFGSMCGGRTLSQVTASTLRCSVSFMQFLNRNKLYEQ